MRSEGLVFIASSLLSLSSGIAIAAGPDYAGQRAIAGPNAMPVLKAGEYGTEVDNQDNAGSGVADGDTYEVMVEDAGRTAADTTTDPSNPEIDMVYVNGTKVGTLSGSDGTWGINYFNIPTGVLRPGANRVKIVPDTGNPSAYWCVSVEMGHHQGHS